MTARKWPKPIKAVLKALADDDSTVDLAGRIFDFAVAQPTSTYVDSATILADIDRAFDETLTEAWVEAHLKPMMARERERAVANGDRVGEWLTAEAKAELRSLAARPPKLDPKFLKGLVKQDAVRHMMRSIVQETLDRFIETVKPGGSGGGIAGSLGRSAFGLAKKAGLGSVGEQIEQQLKRGVAVFVQGSMDLMLERLVVILSSPETATQMARTNVKIFDELMKMTTGKLVNMGDPKIADGLAEALPGLLVHNLERDSVRQGIYDELNLWLAIEGEKPIREHLGDEDAIAATREEVVEVLAPLLVTFCAGDSYLNWLEGVL